MLCAGVIFNFFLTLLFLCVIVFGCVQIREELRANGIDVYPQKEFDEDAEDRMINDKIRVS